MDALTISMISAATALVASIVGPVVTLLVAKRQFDAQVLSTNRQKWIDTFRNQLSELMAMVMTATVLKETWPAGTAWREVLAREPSLRSLVERISIASIQISLMAKDDEPLHQEFIVALKRTDELLLDSAPHHAEMHRQFDVVTALARRIIRSEWGRVKRGI
jgi:hypothetical protein